MVMTGEWWRRSTGSQRTAARSLCEAFLKPLRDVTGDGNAINRGGYSERISDLYVPIPSPHSPATALVLVREAPEARGARASYCVCTATVGLGLAYAALAWRGTEGSLVASRTPAPSKECSDRPMHWRVRDQAQARAVCEPCAYGPAPGEETRHGASPCGDAGR